MIDFHMSPRPLLGRGGQVASLLTNPYTMFIVFRGTRLEQS
jgi:hypothetical protein